MNNVNEKCFICKIENKYVREFCKKCYENGKYNGTITVKKHIISPDKLTKQQEEILIGSMLGDGCLANRKTPYLIINRCTKDKEYLEWEHNIFHDFCNVGIHSNKSFHKKQAKIYYGVSMQTRSSSAFIPFRKQWYNNKTKIIPRDLELTSLIVAIWFMDDGNISIHDRLKNGKKLFSIRFATNGFSYDEVLFLSDLLSKKYEADFYPVKTKSGFIINGANYATVKIIQDIISYIPQCMYRKISLFMDNLQ